MPKALTLPDICVRCRKQPPEAGRVCCTDCLVRMSRYAHEYHKRRYQGTGRPPGRPRTRS